MPDYVMFILVAMLIIISPGPDFILVLNNALTSGMSKGYATTYGIFTGQMVHGLAFVFGMSIIIAKSQVLFEVIKYVGAGYLIYLGVKSLCTKRGTDMALQQPLRLKADRLCFVEGLSSTVFNPKVIIFYLTFMPQFIHVGDNYLAKSALLCGTFFTLVVIWYHIFLFIIHHVQHWFKNGATQMWLNRVAGVALISIGTSLLWKKSVS